MRTYKGVSIIREWERKKESEKERNRHTSIESWKEKDWMTELAKVYFVSWSHQTN